MLAEQCTVLVRKQKLFEEPQTHDCLPHTGIHISDTGSSFNIPSTVSCAVSVDGLLLDTLHWYCPPSLPVTVRVWVYCAVTGSSNTVIPPETVSESLVQVTVVAGPPVEMQVRVN